MKMKKQSVVILLLILQLSLVLAAIPRIEPYVNDFAKSGFIKNENDK